MTRALIVFGLLAGCGGESYLVVTVDARPAVHDAAKLAITLQNAGTMRTDVLNLGSHSFPLSFSVSAPGRSGTLDLIIEAQDHDGIPVGLGTSSAMLSDHSAMVMLDSTDFVVNTDVAMDQFLAANNAEVGGLQLASNSDGTWTVAFRDNCNQTGMCNMFGRKLDANGVPVVTTLAGNTNQFVLSTMLTTSSSYPAVASNGTKTIAVWDFTGPTSTRGVACRWLDASGTASAGQLAVTADAAQSVAATPLSNGNFAVSWEIDSPTPIRIRTIIVKPDCTMLTAGPVDVSTVVGAVDGPLASHVAASGSNVMYTWIVDGDVHVRPGTNAGPSGTDITLLPHSAQYVARIARIVGTASGFAIAVRWGNKGFMGPGKIELFQVSTSGTLAGPPTLITDQSLGDFASGSQPFGIAARSDGPMLVAWHQCDAMGTLGSCDVLGRFLDTSGQPASDIFPLATTTVGDQTGPSVTAIQGSPDGTFAVAWTDESHVAPDTQGKAVRARIIYPPTM
jgi:hypothetical protein